MRILILQPVREVRFGCVSRLSQGLGARLADHVGR